VRQVSWNPDALARRSVLSSQEFMHATVRRPSFRVVVLVGIIYALVGVAFALPASRAGAWRLAAWIVSGVAYMIHVGYECFRLRNSSVTAALHVALAAALGALGLALGAIAHALSISTTTQHQRLLLVALVAWLVITGVPAFLVGLGISGLLTRLRRRGHVQIA
jgi:hypothetical protein